MARPKKDTVIVRFPVPREAYQRFQRLARVLSLDVPMAVRMCASLQLAQFEVTVLGPDLSETVEGREARTTRAAEELLPELHKPEPEPKPFGFGPRSDADGQGVELAEVAQPAERAQPLLAPVRRAQFATWLNL